jgi:gamma-glutamylaminecyclotransferase
VGRTPLFVYGTLLSGQRSHDLLRGSLFAGSARTAPVFDLLDLGEYPALVTGGHTAIHGELYWVARATRANLDDFEGHPTVYRRSWISLAGGELAETYLLALPSTAYRSIPHGDWRATG